MCSIYSVDRSNKDKEETFDTSDAQSTAAAAPNDPNTRWPLHSGSQGSTETNPTVSG